MVISATQIEPNGSVTEPFADVPCSARGHLGLIFYQAARLAIIQHLCRISQPATNNTVLTQYPFLGRYLTELESRWPQQCDLDQGAAWLESAILDWEQQADVFLPLLALREQAELTRSAIVTLVLLGLTEEDASFGSLFAEVQGTLGQRRPTAALVQSAVSTVDQAIDQWADLRSLDEIGVISTINPNDARPERIYRIHAPIWDAICGEYSARSVPQLQRYSRQAFTAIDTLPVYEEYRPILNDSVDLLATGQVDTVVIRGPQGCARRDVVGSLARHLGRDLLSLVPNETGAGSILSWFGALAILTQAMPVFELELGPGETFDLPSLAGFREPRAVILGREGGLRNGRREIVFDLPPDGPTLRARHWQDALGDFAGGRTTEFAENFTLSGNYIRQCAGSAIARARLAKRSIVNLNDVRLATRELQRHVLEPLAERLEPEARGWQRLVVSPAVAAELEDLERRARQRERLSSAVGDHFPGGFNRGCRILLEGPSGCGKSLTSRALAGVLHKEIYRLDLSAVVNKYIGETEKNLAQIFSRAQDLDVILLLDECDSLMAPRTANIRNANDKYSNLETNYLLQALESYDGVLIAATNMEIDSAFRRRLDVAIRFRVPEPEERLQLWHTHLNGHLHSVNLDQIAFRYTLHGGQIRNAVAYAYSRALAAGRDMNGGDILAAIDVEHRKTGSTFVAPQEQIDAQSDGGLADFLNSVG